MYFYNWNLQQKKNIRRRFLLFSFLMLFQQIMMLLMFSADSLREVMPLKLSLFMSFSPWNGRQYWFVLVFSHGFLVVYTYLALLSLCQHWLVDERPLTLNFSHFPSLIDCSNASPEARTVLRACFLFSLGQMFVVLNTEHKIRIFSHVFNKCMNAPSGCWISSDGNLAGKFKNITKK